MLSLASSLWPRTGLPTPRSSRPGSRPCAKGLRAVEELWFVMATKRQGRFVVPVPTVVTSGRKLPLIPAWEVPLFLFRFFKGARREDLDFLYGKRSGMCRKQMQFSTNAILVITVGAFGYFIRGRPREPARC